MSDNCSKNNIYQIIMSGQEVSTFGTKREHSGDDETWNFKVPTLNKEIITKNPMEESKRVKVLLQKFNSVRRERRSMISGPVAAKHVVPSILSYNMNDTYTCYEEDDVEIPSIPTNSSKFVIYED